MNTNIPSHLLNTYHQDRINQDTNGQSNSFIGNLIDSIKLPAVFKKQDTSRAETKRSTQSMEQVQQA